MVKFVGRVLSLEEGKLRSYNALSVAVSDILNFDN